MKRLQPTSWHWKGERKATKDAWGPGPWHDEPDKLQWSNALTGLPCLIVRNQLGALCGYVGIDSNHPWFGLLYHECTLKPKCVAAIEGSYCEHTMDYVLECYGGVSYSDKDYGFCGVAPAEHIS